MSPTFLVETFLLIIFPVARCHARMIKGISVIHVMHKLGSDKSLINAALTHDRFKPFRKLEQNSIISIQ